jgi:hypothetical protein
MHYVSGLQRLHGVFRVLHVCDVRHGRLRARMWRRGLIEGNMIRSGFTYQTNEGCLAIEEELFEELILCALELGLRWLNDRASPYSTPERMRRVYRHYVDCKNENERLKRLLVETEYSLAKLQNGQRFN